MSEILPPPAPMTAETLVRCPRAECSEFVPKEDLAEHIETAHDR